MILGHFGTQVLDGAQVNLTRVNPIK
jgi:hypothetical protein